MSRREEHEGLKVSTRGLEHRSKKHLPKNKSIRKCVCFTKKLKTFNENVVGKYTKLFKRTGKFSSKISLKPRIS